MVRALWSQPDARPIIQPEPTLLGLFLRDFQPLPPPDPLDPFMIYLPAAVVQHSGDHAISIASELFCQCNDILGRPFFVRQADGHLALRRTMPHLVDTSTATGRA